MPAASTIGSVAPIERPVAMTTTCSSAARRNAVRIGGVMVPSWSTRVPSMSRQSSRSWPASSRRCVSRRVRAVSRSVIRVVASISGSVSASPGRWVDLRRRRADSREARCPARRRGGAGVRSVGVSSGPEASGVISGHDLEDLASSQIGAQAFGDHHRAVGLLVVLEDRGDEAGGGQGAVEGGDGAQAVLGALADVQPARLELGAVRGGGQLAVGLLTGHPGLAVELAGGGGAQVNRSEHSLNSSHVAISYAVFCL